MSVLAEVRATGRFDHVTRLARTLLAAPRAAVLLTGDRLPHQAGPGARRVPEGLAPTDPAAADLVVVPDAGPSAYLARAYAAHALRVGGHRVGTLCVLDDAPRPFSGDQLHALADLAAVVENELRADADRTAARELATLRRRTEMVLAGVADGVVGVDAAGRVSFVNAAAEDLLGWTSRDILGADLHALTHARLPDGRVLAVDDCPVTDVLRAGTVHRGLRGTFWRHDGSPIPTDWSAGPVLDGDAVVGAVVVFGDASARLEVERLKDEFTSVVSHELRTPLTSLKAALELLAHGAAGPVPERVTGLLDIATRNAARLAHLVDDVLDVEKSARGSLVLHREPLEVEALMRSAAATVEGTAVAQGIDVVVEPATASIWGDAHRLVQVLTNLLGNAMRFSPAGSVVRLRGHGDDTAVHLEVVDEGVGIPADALDRVFDRFWQVDGSHRRAAGGTGLGLAIAKNIVEAHGGRITVDSEVGVGSTFTVHLPVRSRSVAVPDDRRRSPEEIR